MFGVTKNYQVVPDGNNWEVMEGIGTVSKHQKKSAAKRKAKQLVSEGDKLTIRKADGTIQDVKTY